jgi:hypothetical protein
MKMGMRTPSDDDFRRESDEKKYEGLHSVVVENLKGPFSYSGRRDNPEGGIELIDAPDPRRKVTFDEEGMHLSQEPEQLTLKFRMTYNRQSGRVGLHGNPEDRVSVEVFQYWNSNDIGRYQVSASTTPKPMDTPGDLLFLETLDAHNDMYSERKSE